MQKRWLNTQDFAEEFKIQISTQAKLRKQKILPYSKIGGFIFYDRILIDRQFEKHNVVNTEVAS